MRALVVGVTGQLAIELRRACPSVSGLTLCPAEQVDLADSTAVVELLGRARPELIINAAAYTAVDNAEREAAKAFAVNAEGPATLARWCERHQAALLHVSTDYVFDGLKGAPYTESDATSPQNVYGKSKLEGEFGVRRELERHIILRTSWVFSAHGRNFVKTMLRLAGEQDEVKVVADQRGRPTAAADLASALWLLATRLVGGDAPSWGTFHFAGAGVAGWHEVAAAVFDRVERETGKSTRVIPIATSDYPTPAARPLMSALDTSLFEHSFGASPRPWRVALAEVLDELLGESSA